MLRKLTELSPEDGARLMAVYRESNGENAAWFAPGAPTPAEGLRRTEAGFLAWLREDFLPKKENTLWVWEEDGIFLSALRLTELDGFLWLEALETRPDRRGQGCGEQLLRALAAELSQAGGACVRSCVGKKNRLSPGRGRAAPRVCRGGRSCLQDSTGRALPSMRKRERSPAGERSLSLFFGIFRGNPAQ